jgi:excisionase family DNA binding protein
MSNVIIPPASVRLNPSQESDWARAVFEFVSAAAAQGKTVMVSADEKQLSPNQAAQIAHVSRMTIQRRIDDGTIKAVRRGSRWRIPETELDRYRQQVWSDTMTAMADDF